MISPNNGGDSDENTQTTYTQEELEDMTIAQIEALAEELGYTITKTLKADIIDEFLEQQNG